MKPKLEAWTIVVAGGWNTRIFSAEWIGNNLIDANVANLELSLGPPLSLRIRTGGLLIIPAEDRLIVGVQEPSLPLMEKAEALVLKVLQLLPHTPVSAVGINFGFDDPAPSVSITSLFRTTDLTVLSSAGYGVKHTAIIRRLEMNGTVVNVNQALSSDDGQLETRLNFHFDTKTAEDAVAQIRGKTKICLDLAKDFLVKIYDCNIEEAAT